MITKDELERLKQPADKNEELHYTIGGAIETAVHSNVESERINKRQSGQRIMNQSVEEFRNEMAFKSREGLVQAQFQQNTENDAPPPQDCAIAEETWRQNQIQVHEQGFDRASEDLQQQTASAFENRTQIETIRAASSHERVQEFAAAMTNQQSQTNER